MVAERDGIDTRGDQLAIDARRQARAVGGVFGIGNDQIQPLAIAQAGHRAGDDPLARLADDVAYEEESHVLSVVSSQLAVAR